MGQVQGAWLTLDALLTNLCAPVYIQSYAY
jgi:hypothetical protein